jgi:peptide/nickel transport system permease protein
LVAPHPVGAFVDDDVFSGLSARFWLGSDYLGRDVFSRLLYGALYGVSGAGRGIAGGLLRHMSCALGHAGGGRVDEVISRLMDTLISIPSRSLRWCWWRLAGLSLWLLLICAVTYVPGNFRIARALAMNLASLDFVAAARARGEEHLSPSTKCCPTWSTRCWPIWDCALCSWCCCSRAVLPGPWGTAALCRPWFAGA